MGLITVKTGKNWKDTNDWLNKLESLKIRNALEEYAETGLQLLRDNTPVDTGLTRDSWSYEIKEENGKVSLSYSNSNRDDYENSIVLLLVYGHPTRNGGYVIANDFVTPSVTDVFDNIVNKIWEEVN